MLFIYFQATPVEFRTLKNYEELPSIFSHGVAEFKVSELEAATNFKSRLSKSLEL
jgi:hypothetical protein